MTLTVICETPEAPAAADAPGEEAAGSEAPGEPEAAAQIPTKSEPAAAPPPEGVVAVEAGAPPVSTPEPLSPQDGGPAAPEEETDERPAPELPPAAEALAADVQDSPAQAVAPQEEPPHIAPATTAPVAERKPGPATEAARRAAGWPVTADAAAPAKDLEGRAEPGAPEGLRAWALQSGKEQELDLTAEAEGVERARETAGTAPRRGFFARLFGLRRSRDADTTPPSGASGSDTVDESPLASSLTTEGAELDPLGEPQAAGERPTAIDAEDTAQAAAEELMALDGDSVDLDAEMTEECDDGEPVAGDLDAEATEEPDEGEPVATDEPALEAWRLAEEPEASERAPSEDEMASEALAGEPGDAEPERAEPIETPAVGQTEDSALTEHAPAAVVPEADSRPAGQDLAAELRAAEEVAAEQVEAVLTAVLDRLGAAHHRPFSRS